MSLRRRAVTHSALVVLSEATVSLSRIFQDLTLHEFEHHSASPGLRGP